MKTIKNIGIKESMFNLLDTTKNEIEQFRHELSHEKVEVLAKYHELKEQLKIAVKEMQELILLNNTVTRETAEALNKKLLALEQQLAVAKENTTDDLKIHLTTIKNTLIGIVTDLGKEKSYNQTLEQIRDRLHRFTIKFDILKLKLELGKMDMKEVIQGAKHQVTKKINALKDFPHKSEVIIKNKWKEFQHGVNEVYSDLHNVFTIH